MIKLIKENIISDNGYVKVHNDFVSFNDNQEGQYFKYSNSASLPNYCVIIICQKYNLFYLQENFRYAHQKYILETVKGMGMVGKTPLETATIEVREEIGGVIESIDYLGEVLSDITDTKLHCYHANLSDFSDSEHENTEFFKNLKGYTFEEVLEMIANGGLSDIITLSAFIKFISKIK